MERETWEKWTSLMRYLEDHGPTRSEELRAALGISRLDMVMVIALAVDTWKKVGRRGDRRSTTYSVRRSRG